MKRYLRQFVIYVLTVIFLAVIAQSASAKINEFSFIGKEADVVIFVNNDLDDPGFNYVSNLWRDRFEIKEPNIKNEAINRLYSELPIATIVGAAYLPEKAFDKEKKPIYPEFIVIVEIKKDQDVFKDALDILITKRKPLGKIEHEGYEITYRDKKLEPYHGQKDLAAYVQIGKYFVIAMSPRELCRAIDTYKGKRESFSANKSCLELLKEVPDTDAYLLINNESGLFSKNLRRWEEIEGMRVLLSSEAISEILFSLDLATDDSIKGELVFKPKESKNILDIEDDAYFFEEIINRSLVKQDINWISEVETVNNKVVLKFEGIGFKKIWEELLLNKRVVFLEKEKEEAGQDEQPNIQSKLVSRLIKLIFVLFIVIIALVVAIFIKRKK